MINLSDEEKKIVVNVLSAVKGVAIILFGSRVKGGNKVFSDLDICLKGDDRVDLLLIGDLKEQFEKSNLPFVVDIVDYNRTSPSFQHIIDKEGRELSDV